jgi:hypothetical protein
VLPLPTHTWPFAQGAPQTIVAPLHVMKCPQVTVEGHVLEHGVPLPSGEC